MSDGEAEEPHGALLDEEESSAPSVADSTPMDNLPAYVVARVAKLQSLDEERERIMVEYLAERAALENKYAARCQTLYDTRCKIVNGEMDEQIDQEEASKSNESKEEEDKKTELPDPHGEKLTGVPQFWICAMSQVETIGELITEEDVGCLDNLKDITCKDDDDGRGFTLSFHFGPNEYFHDVILTKRYEVPNLLASDEPLLKQVDGCKIQWKEDKSLTFRKVKKTQRGKGKNEGQVRTVVKTEKEESFFHWFDPPKMPSMEEMDEEEAKRLEEIFDSDYEVAQAFRTQLIPRAVMWFSGEAADRDIIEAMSDAVTNESGEEPAQETA